MPAEPPRDERTMLPSKEQQCGITFPYKGGYTVCLLPSGHDGTCAIDFAGVGAAEIETIEPDEFMSRCVGAFSIILPEETFKTVRLCWQKVQAKLSSERLQRAAAEHYIVAILNSITDFECSEHVSTGVFANTEPSRAAWLAAAGKGGAKK
jgi:hypothetical protein